MGDLTCRQLELLRAVAAGRVTRDALLGDLGPDLLDGRPLGWSIQALAFRGLVVYTFAGTPRLTARGRRVLATHWSMAWPVVPEGSRSVPVPFTSS